LAQVFNPSADQAVAIAAKQDMEELIGPKLLVGSSTVDVASSLKASRVGLYFASAASMATTMRLAKVYKRAKEQSKSLDIVFISEDAEQKQFDDHFSRMPWNAVPWSDRERAKSVARKFNVVAPALVLVDRDGNVQTVKGTEEAVKPGFIPSLPLAMHAEDPPAAITEPVQVQVRCQGREFVVTCAPEEGWALLQLQIYSLTNVAVEQQRLFGLGVEHGCLNVLIPTVSLGVALAAAAAKGGAPPTIVVLGNFTKNDPFEVEPVTKKRKDARMVEEQQVAMLQAKLGGLPQRLQHFLQELQSCLRYETRSLQMTALDPIPVVRLDNEVQVDMSAGDTDDGYDVLFMKKLLRWFKHSFFKWVNIPECEHCGSKNTKRAGGGQATAEEKQYGARNVEVATCSDCGGQTRFPRYNDPAKLLQTRSGRCGEWANTFTLVVRALGFEARIVHDWTDHVWTEVWSESKQKWLHADSCEAALDSPLVYEKGWGKKLTYCIAFARDHVRDVTLRYTRNYNSVLQRRNQFSEAELERAVKAVSDYALDRELLQILPTACQVWKSSRADRSAQEDKDFQEYRSAAPALEVKPEEQIGRTSGDKAWRESRGELGSTAAARARALAESDAATCATADAGPKLHGDWLLERSELVDCHSDEAYKVLAESSALPASIQKVTISAEWKDQDHGNKKGRMQIALRRGTAIVAEEDLFGLCRENGASGWRKVTKSLSPGSSKVVSQAKADDKLALMYKVGGGGGHQLHIRNFQAAMDFIVEESEEMDEETRAAIALSLQEEQGSAAAASPAEDPKAKLAKLFAQFTSEGMTPTEAAAAAVKQLTAGPSALAPQGA